MFQPSSAGVSAGQRSIVALVSLLGIAVVAFSVQMIGPVAAAVLLGAVACLVLSNYPFAGFVILVACLPVEGLVTLDGEIPVTKGLAVVVAGLWVVRRLVYRLPWKPILQSGLIRTFGLLGLYCYMSVLWADYHRDTYAGLLGFVQSLAFAVVTFDVLYSWKRLHQVIVAIVSTGAVAGAMTFIQYQTEGVARAGGGITAGINGTAIMLVSLMPFAVFLWHRNHSRLLRTVAAVYITCGSLGLAVTFSRSSWVMLALLIGAYCLRSLASGTTKAMIVVACLAVIGLMLTPQEQLIERGRSIGPMMQSMLQGLTDDASLTDSRGYHWRVGAFMFRDSPFVGQGYNNYPRLFRMKYQFLVRGTDQYYYGLRSPHSTYVGLAAELGMVGLMLWFFCLGCVGYTLVKAWGMLRRHNFMYECAIVEAIGLCFCLQLGFGWSTTVHFDTFFWALCGIAYATHRCAQATVSERSAQPLRAPDPRCQFVPQPAGHPWPSRQH